MSSSESLEMEPLTEKHRSLKDSFSDSESEDDIVVHGEDDGPSNEDRQLLNEEDEREKLLTKRRKVLIGSKKKDRREGSHGRRKSIESYMEDGTLNTSSRRSKIKRRRVTAKRIICCHAIVFTVILLGIVITLLVRGLSRPLERKRPAYQGVKVSNGTNEFRSTVLIISLDGFRPDYLDRELTPNMHALREAGVAPEFMRPSFPSVTFPNHYTLVTGLYPESHGIVGNHFWDPVLMDEFNVGKPETLLPSKWWEGTSGGLVEPIWVTAENQGVISAIHMWPGSESVIHGVQATHVDKFNEFESLSNKVNRVLSWLDMSDEERPAFIATYVPTIDTVGHHYGPDSKELNASLVEVDSMIGSIVTGLEQRNLTDIVNLIIVSDHGMATTSNSRIIYLDSLLDLSTIDHFDCWPLKGLRPVSSENTTAIYTHLKSLSADQPWNVYARDIDMPSHWHFTSSYRIAPIYVVPDPGWIIVNSLREFDPEEDGEYQPKGVHGYDNDDVLMRSLFLARGPGFKYTYEVAPFDNTEVYGIMMSILGITPNANNGTFVKGRLPKLESTDVAVVSSSNTGIVPPSVTSSIANTEASAEATSTGLPDMTEADWEQIEEDLAEAAAEDRPLTWKEYLELKAEAMREELDEWWDWMKHGGSDPA